MTTAKQPNLFSESDERARLILGDDYISPKKIATAYGVSYSDEQLRHFEDTMPSSEKITWCKANNFMLVPGFIKDLNMLDVWELNSNHFCYEADDWFTHHDFSRDDKVVAGEWLIIRKHAVPKSFIKTWKDQQDLVTENEYVPNAPTVSYAVTTYHKVRGIYLLRGTWVRTSSVTERSEPVRVSVAGGDRVSYYSSGREGLVVSECWGQGNRCMGNIGVASALIT